ncbi:hypothetical protein AB0M94_40205 [Streptomyces xanthochromogenes]
MPSIDYPFPDPKTEEERQANWQAGEDYQRAEEEGSDLNEWEEELGWR